MLKKQYLVNEKSIAYAIGDIVVLFDYTQRSGGGMMQQQRQQAVLSWSVKEVINCLSATGAPLNYHLGVGTNTCIYVFDTRTQSPIYYTAVDDGVFSLLPIQSTLFLAGCNCSIQVCTSNDYYNQQQQQ